MSGYCPTCCVDLDKDGRCPVCTHLRDYELRTGEPTVNVGPPGHSINDKVQSSYPENTKGLWHRLDGKTEVVYADEQGLWRSLEQGRLLTTTSPRLWDGEVNVFAPLRRSHIAIEGFTQKGTKVCTDYRGWVNVADPLNDGYRAYDPIRDGRLGGDAPVLVARDPKTICGRKGCICAHPTKLEGYQLDG